MCPGRGKQGVCVKSQDKVAIGMAGHPGIAVDLSLRVANVKGVSEFNRHSERGLIVEVGTYLGRSGLSLLTGSQLGLAGDAMPRLHTCDMSANEARFGPLKENVNYFGKTKSTEMFATLVQQGVKADLVFLDGRLQNDDLPLLRGLLKPETVFAFDDFEGNEKGVYNSNLVLQLLGGELYSIYPPTLADLAALQILGHSFIALGLPPTSIKLTRQ